VTTQEQEELDQIERSILAAVEDRAPYPPHDLFATLRERGFSENLVRAAIWFLVDANKLGFDHDRQLVPVTSATGNG
jgi:hypothetical protein